MARYEDQKKARKLRAQGKTLSEIGAMLGAGKGLVSLWVRDVEISDKGQARIEKKKEARKNFLCKPNAPDVYPHLAAGRNKLSLKRFEERESFRESGRIIARLGNKADHAVGCSLYWGEGSKSINSCQLINSDVNMLKTFVNFCRKYFDLKTEDFKLTVTAYTSVHSAENIVNYWEKELGLEGVRMLPHNFDVLKYKSRGQNPKTVGKLPYGCCRVSIRNATRIVQHIYGALEVYGGTHLYPVRQDYKEIKKEQKKRKNIALSPSG